MTTIERAKKFFKRIHYWAGKPSIKRPDWPPDEFNTWMYHCQSRVARALIRQERDEAHRHAEKTMEQWDVGYSYGFQDALEILDAVYGREE